MATPLQRAQQALDQGRMDDAKQAFQEAASSESTAAYANLGLALAAMGTGDLRGALDFARKAMQSSEQPESDLVMGAIYSRMGERGSAEQHLESYLQQVDDSAYGRALLGEQRVRTGRWNEGIQDFLHALQQDTEGRAYRHLQKVCADLTNAVANGPVPQSEARKFINQVEYGLPGNASDKSQFLSQVRRALNSGRVLDPPDAASPLREAVAGALPADPGGNATPSSTQRASEHEARASGTDPTPSDEADDEDAVEDSERGIRPKEKDLAAVIQSDRQKNEGLQDEIGDVPAPDWPSSLGEGDLDPLPSMAWERQSIFADRPDMDSTDFRITSGNVRTEIFLERCMQNLLTSAKQNRAVSIHFQPETITRIEINCLDGLLEDLPETSPIYEEKQNADRYRSYALGRFLGACIAKPYDGTWDYDATPEKTRLIVGNQRLDPIGRAREWLEADDPDEVDLRQLLHRAERGDRMSTSLTIRQQHIDPTRELEGQSLEVKLAELWTNYLFRLSDVSFSDLASTISLRSTDDRTVVFTLGREYAPEAAAGPSDAAAVERVIDETDRTSSEGTSGADSRNRASNETENQKVPVVHIAYLRDSGEFLLLGSRKHMARYVGEAYGELTDDAATNIAEAIASYHRPGWFVASDKEKASNLASSIGSGTVGAPSITRSSGHPELRIWGARDDELVGFALAHRPNRDTPWELRLAR